MEECTYAPHVAHSCSTCQDSDNLLFQIAAKRVIDEIDRFPVSFPWCMASQPTDLDGLQQPQWDVNLYIVGEGF